LGLNITLGQCWTVDALLRVASASQYMPASLTFAEAGCRLAGVAAALVEMPVGP
jgi:hypothetical protein